MDYRETLSAELPAPRDDEPAGLRRDIVDELGDHLTCAYNRELLRGSDANEARERVLHRFGDPATVARRLWLDAIGGKIMAQRVLMATCFVLTLVSLSLAGVIWRQGYRAQQETARATAQAEHALALLNAKAQASQQEMLKQLREVSAEIRVSRSLEWVPVTFNLTEEAPDGPFAVGFSVTLNEPSLGTGAARPTTLLSNDSGIADFGVVRPGYYSFQIVKQWDQGALNTFGALNIKPGSQIHKRIICPKAPLERVPIRIRTAWPADLQREGLILYARFVHNPIRLDDLSWHFVDKSVFPPVTGNGFTPDGPIARKRRVRPSIPNGTKRELRVVLPSHLIAAGAAGQFGGAGMGGGGMGMGGAAASSRSVLCGPGRSMAEILTPKELYIWRFSKMTKPTVLETNLSADLLASDLREIKEPDETLTWERGAYRMRALFVLRPHESADDKRWRKRFEIVVASDLWGQIRYADQPPIEKDFANGPMMMGFANMTDSPNLVLPRDYWSKVAAAFEAHPGQVNEWTIPLPDELIEAVRKGLKAAQ